jgi:SAM-dependent methyltransferase
VAIKAPNHPIEGIDSVDELLRLPYFEILACLGGNSLHPGGGAATQLLLDTCGLHPSARVLEVGCGPGWTTRALLKANISVTVVERSRRMLDAMLFHCANEKLTAPEWVHSSIEDFRGIDGLAGAFDLLILECVIGFVNDKPRLVESLVNQLAPRGRIGVLDVHYVEAPPLSTLASLKAVTGHSISPLMRSDWEGLFGRLTPVTFQEFKLPVTTSDSGARIVAASGISSIFEDTGRAGLDQLARYLDEAGAVFNENKRHLLGHIAVWELPA